MHSSSFRQEIGLPLRNGEEEGFYTLQTLLRIMMLRRAKDIIDMPPREYVLIEVEASLEGREIYNIARKELEPLFMKALHSRNYDSGVRVLQSILRQGKSAFMARTYFDWRLELGLNASWRQSLVSKVLKATR